MDDEYGRQHGEQAAGQRWENAGNLPGGKTLGTFQVGSAPLGIAFDGANIWTANSGDGTVSKLRASNGKTLGTFSPGGNPYGIGFDGVNIWVSGNYVFEFRASDGKQILTFNTPNTNTIGVAFDGAPIFMGGLNDNTVWKF